MHHHCLVSTLGPVIGIACANAASPAYSSAGTVAFNGSGQVESVTGPDGRSVRFEYDAAGRLVSSSDSDGRVFTFEYDGRGRLASVADAAGTGTRRSERRGADVGAQKRNQGLMSDAATNLEHEVKR